VTAPVFHAPASALASALPAARLRLEGPEGRHAATVRRVARGEVVDLVDGEGTRVRCVVVAVGRDTVDLDVTQRVVEPNPSPRLVLAQALVKGDRGELAVELATEAGVDEVIPWVAARSVAQWRGERGERALERWRSTAREAAKQSRRARWPLVPALCDGTQLAGRAAGCALAVVLHEEAAEPLAGLALPTAGDVLVVVGPEGGFTGAELAALAAVGARACHLGPGVLRASTAGVAALAVLSAVDRWR